jgi:hypothetical protein
LEVATINYSEMEFIVATNLEYLGFGGYKYPNGVLNIDLNYLKNKPFN